MLEPDKEAEIEEMWAEHKRSAESHWREHYGRDPLPEDLQKFPLNPSSASLGPWTGKGPKISHRASPYSRRTKAAAFFQAR